MVNDIFERPNLEYNREATLRTLNSIADIKDPLFDEKKRDPRYVQTLDRAFVSIERDEELLSQKAHEARQREYDRVRAETSQSFEESDSDSNTVVLVGGPDNINRMVNYAGFLNHQYSEVDRQLEAYLQELSESREDLTCVLHRLTEIAALTAFDHNHRNLHVYSVNGTGLYEFHAEFATLADLRIVHGKRDIPAKRFKDSRFLRDFRDEKAASVGTNTYLATNPGRYCSHRSLLEKAFDEFAKAIDHATKDFDKDDGLKSQRREFRDIFMKIHECLDSVD